MARKSARFSPHGFRGGTFFRVCRIMLEKLSIVLSGVTRETRVLCSKLCSAGGIILKLCRTKMTLPPHPIPPHTGSQSRSQRPRSFWSEDRDRDLWLAQGTAQGLPQRSYECAWLSHARATQRAREWVAQFP